MDAPAPSPTASRRRPRGNPPRLVFRPVTSARWPDLERLFGERGACGGCWCMYWRQRQSEYQRLKGEGNRRRLRALVKGGAVPGILAYLDGTPVGWCAVAPRASYARLARSRVLAPVDEAPVWSVVCFFIDRAHRLTGMTAALLRAAAAHARRRGGRILEGYPIEPRRGDVPPPFAFTGLAAAFRKAGFREVARRSDTRPIMRLVLGGR
ncbi:MAG: GNAT family N-acetyltransferase [Candidatus Polarisedimenticolia bacterium]